MRVLVIGGTRFAGPYVVGRLVEEGHEVAVFNRGETGPPLEGVRRLRGDRRNLASFADEFRRLAPDVVLDMIPMNEREARDVMRVFEGIAQRVIAVSSGDVYRAYDRATGRDPGPPDPVPLDEGAPLRQKLYPYKGEGVEEYEKILVEEAVMGDPELSGTVLRLPAAIALAVTDERAAGRTYNVGEVDPLPWAEWVREIGRAAGWSGEVVVVPKNRLPEHLDWGLDTNHHFFTDTSRIRRELEYEETVSRSEALRDTVNWERRHPPARVDPALFDYAAEEAVLTGLLGR